MNTVSIQSLILQSQNPDNKALISSAGIISYYELDKETNSLSNFLLNKGIKKKERVAVIYNHSAEFIKIIISLWKINAVPVVMNIRLMDAGLIEQIRFSECSKIIIDKNTTLFEDDSIRNKIFYPDKLTEANPVLNLITKDDTALIIFTSGSTGKPKAVVHTFESLFRSAVISNQILEQTEKSRWLASLPFYHIGGFSIITRSLILGCSIIIPDSLKTEVLDTAINKYLPTHCSLVPTQLKRLIDYGVKPGNKLLKILIGGGWITKELTTTAITNKLKIIKVYGSTETASMAAAIGTEDISGNHLSVGKILKPNKLKIIDNSGNELPANFSGEILISSPALFKEYLNNPDETKAKLTDGWYHTGDIGYLDNDSFLFLESRRTDLIISGGENINPAEIEEALLKNSAISDAIVFGAVDEMWGEVISAIVVLKESKIRLSPDEIINYLRNLLASFKVPKNITIVDEIPRNEIGKIDREALKKMYSKNH